MEQTYGATVVRKMVIAPIVSSREKLEPTGLTYVKTGKWRTRLALIALYRHQVRL